MVVGIAGLVGSTSELGGNLLGDFRSSEASSSEFFDQLDTDRDGQVERDEIREFLGEDIGGRSLDDAQEIERGLSSTLAAVDVNSDGMLSRADLSAYWSRLGALLSVAEVAEWIVHAVQLPETVGDAFRENSVSGYDFPDLVEDDGKALETELAIHRPADRRRIVRSIRMMMTGVGRAPEPPRAFSARPADEAAPCGQLLRLTWSAADGGHFPVHKYRVQRRTLPPRLTRRASERDENLSREMLPAAHLNSTAPSDWVDIFDGMLLEHSDPEHEPALGALYRLCAWNCMGRSEPVLLEVPALEQCSARAEMLVVDDGGTRGVIGGSGGGTRVGGEDDARDGGDASGGSAFARVRAALAMLSSGLGCFSTAASFVSQIIFVLGSIATISLRAQRAALTSSHEPPAASAYVQDFFRRVFDKLGRVASGRDLAQPGDGAVVAGGAAAAAVDPALVGTARVATLPPEMVLRRSESDTSLPLKQQSGSLLPPPVRIPSPAASKARVALSPLAADRRCSLCQKAFRLLRTRHHCLLCARVFCGRCGTVAHAKLLSCPVGSNCVCGECDPPQKSEKRALSSGPRAKNWPRVPSYAWRSLARGSSAPIPETPGTRPDT